MKVGAPVILIRNLFHESPTLVNSLAGHAGRFPSAGPVIKIKTGQLHCVKVCDFPAQDKGHLVARRKQLPLQLYGIQPTPFIKWGLSFNVCHKHLQEPFSLSIVSITAVQKEVRFEIKRQTNATRISSRWDQIRYI